MSGRHHRRTAKGITKANPAETGARHVLGKTPRPYFTAGVALVGATVLAATSVAPSVPDVPADVRVEQTATRLLASSSILNIPLNLLIAAANIPYYESLALQEYAYALGPGGEPGGVPGWIPLSATVANGGRDPGPDGIPNNEDDVYAVGGTGSWWREDFDGNTWGWDNGNWPQMAAISHALLPFAFTLPIAQQLEVFAEAEYIAGANVNCEFNCADVLGYLGRWLMFSTPLTDLLAGTTYPDTVNAYNPADPANPIQPFWAGQPGALLNPLVPFQAIAQNLMQDPSENPVMLPDLEGVLRNGALLGQDFLNNYNPLVTGSFLYWGAPTLYSVPALLAGLVQNFTGIPNQFIETDQWQGEIDPDAPGGVASGGQPSWGPNAGPADLLHGVPAGFEHLVGGLLGYLDPSTYLGISLSNTLLRTYAAGSLPGSDIARLLTGMDPASVLALGNSLPGTGSPESPEQGLRSLTSFTGGNTSEITSTEVPKNERLVTLDAAPDPSLAAPVTDAVTDVVNTSPPAPAQGDTVVAVTPANEARGGTTVVRDRAKFEPPTGQGSGATGGGSNRPGAAIRDVVKGFREAVNSAFGGASKNDTSESKGDTDTSESKGDTDTSESKGDTDTGE